MERLKAALVKVVRSVEGVLPEPPPEVFTLDLGDSAANVKLCVWCMKHRGNMTAKLSKWIRVRVWTSAPTIKSDTWSGAPIHQGIVRFYRLDLLLSVWATANGRNTRKRVSPGFEFT